MTALAPSASSSPISNNIANQPPHFLSIPEELIAHTLSFLSAREIASSCRAVCPELCDFVDRHENLLARPKIKHKHADLQHRINTLTQMKPHDFASFVSSFSYWVDQRGLAQCSDTATYKPFTQWINLMSESDEYEKFHTTTRWQQLTEWLVRLQCNIVRNHVAAHATILHETISRVKPEDKDHAQYTELCSRIFTQSSSQPLFWFKQLDAESGAKMYKIYPVLRLTQATVKGGRGTRVLGPFFSPELLAQLALPPLPDARFCYYVEEEWCRNGLDTGATLSPLEKAALLEVVRIF
jgi:hypothetical protein